MNYFNETSRLNRFFLTKTNDDSDTNYDLEYHREWKNERRFLATYSSIPDKNDTYIEDILFTNI